MRIVIIILFLLLFIPLQAQFESIFGQSSTEWVFEWHNLDFGGQDTVYIEKDTFINGISWKKIMVKTNWFYYGGGLLREDTTTGQVWYKGLQYNGSPLDTIELLNFDFSLEINDTFDISNMYEGSSPLYKKVDTTYYVDGSKYIVFNEQLYAGFPFLEPYMFIEGIGGIMGVLWKQYFGGLQAQYLLCSYKDGVKSNYWNKRHDGNCDILSMSYLDPTFQAKNIRVFPNPFTEDISIDNDFYQELREIEIFDSLGGLMYSSVFSSHFNLAFLQNGLYYIRLHAQKGLTYTQLIIKQ